MLLGRLLNILIPINCVPLCTFSGQTALNRKMTGMNWEAVMVCGPILMKARRK
jgi:hypothetical protein